MSKAQAEGLDTRLFAILAEEYPQSVRGMYYAALGSGLVDKDQHNKRNNYMRVQRRLLKLRRAGTIPYGWITDGSRTVYGHDRYDGPASFARSVAGRYRKDYWADSSVRVEVWVEKDAMAGKLRPVVLEECGLDLYVSRGFASETYLQEAGATIRADGRPTYVYLLTDFDASGMNIAQTVERDLVKHARPVEVTVRRIAATKEQIREYGLITQPVTRSNSRARKFVREHGTQTVELDAILANAVRQLVRESVERHMDARRLEVLRVAEREEREGSIELFGGRA